MSKKTDERPSDVSPSSLSPPDPTSPAKALNSGALGAELPTDATDDLKLETPPRVNPSDDSARKRRRAKASTGAQSGDPNGELQARHSVIGAGLRRLFDEIVEEPIPAEFLQLLDQIDRKREA